MGDAAAEHGLAGIGFVEMDRVHVAGDFAELLDVALGDGVRHSFRDMPGFRSSI